MGKNPTNDNRIQENADRKSNQNANQDYMKKRTDPSNPFAKEDEQIENPKAGQDKKDSRQQGSLASENQTEKLRKEERNTKTPIAKKETSKVSAADSNQNSKK